MEEPLYRYLKLRPTDRGQGWSITSPKVDRSAAGAPAVLDAQRLHYTRELQVLVSHATGRAMRR